MRILILGGTGAMGKALVNLLLKYDHHITVTSRSFHVVPTQFEDKLVYLKGDAHSKDFILDVLSTHWDVIIDFMVYSTAEFKNRLMFLLNSTDQYIFLSSARVYSNNALITEASERLLETSRDVEYLQTDEYALAKARQENLLVGSGLKNWTVIRPYITFSEERLQLGVFEKEDWLYRVMKGRSIVFSRDIATKCTTLTYGNDVARGIASLIGKSDSTGEFFHITSEVPICWNEVLCIYLKVLSSNAIKPKVFWLQDMKVLSDVMNNQYQVKYDRLYNRKFSSHKIKKYVDSSCNLSDSREKLTKCLESFLENPKFKNINWVTQAFMDRVSGEFSSMSEMKLHKDKIKYLLFRFGPISFLLLLRSIKSKFRKISLLD